MNKYKNLTRSTIVLSIGTFGSKLISFFLVSLYTAYLSAAESSAADLVTKTANLIIPLAIVGIDEAIVRFRLEGKYSKQELYSAGLRVMLAGYLGCLALFPFFNWLPDTKDFLLETYLFIFAAGFRVLNQQFIRSRGLLRLFALDGILTAFNLLIAYVVAFVVLDAGSKGYILANVAADICSSVFLMAAAGNFRCINFKSISKGLTKKMLKYALPLLPAYLLWGIVSSSDAFMVKYIVGEEENGLYSVAYKIPMLISFVSAVFYQAWHLSAITEFKSNGAEKFYTNVFGAYSSVMYVGAAGVLAVLIPVTKYVIDAEYFDSYRYAPMLVIAVLMSSMCQFMSSIYAAAKKTKNSLYTSALAAGTNILLNCILIPKFGAQGAAFATMMSYFVCFIVRAANTRRIVAYKINYGRFLFNLAALSAMCTALIADMEYLPVILILTFALVLVFNLSEVLKMARKIMARQ
ncbi:MAG: polysaccharide biosynthesis C-terminal domain-containing protein [Oscillospiraceae bacterium]|jgi:O-antigen/teichoic acid export membrane protein|nr:polysaccharide biosynthesis C-terminal domain-containing protein [Oscillospiraceae bacterium]